MIEGMGLIDTSGEGYIFEKWEATAGEIEDDKVSDTTYTMPAEDAELTANFVEVYELDLEASPADVGTVEDLTDEEGPYLKGEKVTVAADSASGYLFVKWVENGEKVSGDKEYTFEIEADRELTAIFYKQASIKFSLNSKSDVIGRLAA